MASPGRSSSTLQIAPRKSLRVCRWIDDGISPVDRADVRRVTPILAGARKCQTQWFGWNKIWLARSGLVPSSHEHWIFAYVSSGPIKMLNYPHFGTTSESISYAFTRMEEFKRSYIETVIWPYFYPRLRILVKSAKWACGEGGKKSLYLQEELLLILFSEVWHFYHFLSGLSSQFLINFYFIK